MSLNKWLDYEYNKQIVKYRFLRFLFGIIDEDKKNYYIKSIKNLCLTNTKSLIISFQHIVVKDPILSIWLTEEPEKMLKIFQKTIKEIIEDIFPNYFENKIKFSIRISDLPLINVPIGPIESFNSTLVKIQGIVISITNVYSHLSFFKLICLKCLQLQKQIFSNLDKKKEIFTLCYNCKANGPFQISKYHSVYSNFQKVKLQEITARDLYFKVINNKEIILKNELIGIIKLGDEIEVTGIIKYIFQLNKETTYIFPKFSIFIDANYVQKKIDSHNTFFFDFWEKKIISKLFLKNRLLDFLVNSFASTFIIDPATRLAIVLSFFGGKINKTISYSTEKQNINILILGNHDRAKSNILMALDQFLPRSIYMVGEDVNLKELTASLKFDKLIQDWSIEGGTLVMSDKGYCIIDQINKMGILEKKFIKEAISQNKIYVMKNGIIHSFSTRFSIIASANLKSIPSSFFFTDSQLLENYFLKNDFISLFDLIYIIHDTADSLKDKIQINSIFKNGREKTLKIIQKNLKKKQFENNQIIECIDVEISLNRKKIQKLIYKYVNYTRCFIYTQLKNSDRILISNFYILIRNQINLYEGIQISIKNLECLILLIESSARINLRYNPNKIDIHLGISIMLKSFIEFQPIRIKNLLENKVISLFKQRKTEFFELFNLLNIIIKNKKKFYIKKSFFEKFCETFNINNSLFKKFYSSKIFKKNGYKIDKEKIYILYKKLI